MSTQCFKTNESELPRCGLHDVPLTPCDDLIDKDAPYLGYIACLKCSVSNSVVLRAGGFRERVLVSPVSHVAFRFPLNPAI
jgi:hypothetical protein